MTLNKENSFRWLLVLLIAAGMSFVFSFPVKALDPRILERLPMGYTEDSELTVIENAFDKDAYSGGLPEEEKPDGESPEDIPEEGISGEGSPDVLDSGAILDSGIDPQQKMYEDISSIRQGLDIILYFCIPITAATFLIWKFCQWFYCTFVETAWNK